MIPVVTSFDNFNIRWKQISSKIEADCVTSEFECSLPKNYSDSRKYHMTKVVSPQKESISYCIIWWCCSHWRGFAPLMDFQAFDLIFPYRTIVFDWENHWDMLFLDWFIFNPKTSLLWYTSFVNNFIRLLEFFLF